MAIFFNIRRLSALILVLPCLSFAANRYVRPGAGGNGSGSDWTNAYPNLPSSLVRGDTYYLADGDYGSRVFQDANSGTSVITIVKATVADHGTSTGWQDSYGDGQATFSKWQIFTDYYSFNGATRNSDWARGAVNGYGIKVSGRSPVRLDNGSGTGADFVTFQNIDIAAGGRDSGAGDDVIYGLAAHKNITFRNCALRDSDRTIFLMRGEWQNLLVEYSYLARNASSPAVHGEILSDVGSDYVTFRYNVIEDAEGTAVWAVLNGSGGKASWNTATNWKIYGNLVQRSAAYNREGFSGIVFVANDASNRNWVDNLSYYNNTHINLVGTFYGIFIQSPGSGNTVRNNIFYNCNQLDQVNPGVLDSNWYYNTRHAGSGTNEQDCTNSCQSYFANIGSLDARLVKPLAGAVLAAEFGSTLNGLTRGRDGVWDRGAYEYDSGASPVTPPVTPPPVTPPPVTPPPVTPPPATLPAAPTNLRTSVQ